MRRTSSCGANRAASSTQTGFVRRGRRELCLLPMQYVDARFGGIPAAPAALDDAFLQDVARGMTESASCLTGGVPGRSARRRGERHHLGAHHRPVRVEYRRQQAHLVISSGAQVAREKRLRMQGPLAAPRDRPARRTPHRPHRSSAAPDRTRGNRTAAAALRNGRYCPRADRRGIHARAAQRTAAPAAARPHPLTPRGALVCRAVPRCRRKLPRRARTPPRCA